ncbi:LOW QUALITY PROTEIN: hypothetical protein IFM46972_10967, partial [Aspergillus udagawae]
LNNINFYHHPPPLKPPTHTLSSSSWKLYHVPSAPQSFLFSYPLPPKPPATVTAVLTSMIKGHLQFAAPHNIFNIELENIPTQENSLVERETDLDIIKASPKPEMTLDASPTLSTWKISVIVLGESLLMLWAVTSLRMLVLPVIPAGTDDYEGDGGGEGGGN